MKNIIERAIAQAAKDLWHKYPVLTITGPRQSGKTTLARELFPSAEYVNLEIPDVRDQAMRDARSFIERHPAPVVFDEIQRVPMLLSYIQAKVDETQNTSCYVLTGSHQPSLQATIAQSLAGRTGILELLPLSIAELTAANKKTERDHLIFNGFMPRLYSSRLDAPHLYSDYFKTYIERDLRQLANLRHIRQFELFIKLLAGRVAQVLNVDSLANDTGVSSGTIREWLSLLEALYIIKLLPPYYRNFGKRFIKSPKIYFVETGLVSYLLGIKEIKQVATHPLIGNLFENMVIMDVFKKRLNAGNDGDLYFMRTNHGVEVDLVEEVNGKLDLYEIKAGATFHDEMARNLRAIENSLKGEIGKKTVVYAGTNTIVNEVEYLNYAEL